MGTKSAVVLPQRYWAIKSGNSEERNITHPNCFKEIASWDLRIGLRVSALQGGLFMFDYGQHPGAGPTSDWYRQDMEHTISAVQARTKVMNAFFLCLHSMGVAQNRWGIKGMRVSHNDLIHVLDGDFSVNGLGIERISAVAYSGPFRPSVISKGAITSACELLDFVALHEYKKALELIALTNEALASYEDHNFSSALITAWTVCEVMLEHHWKSYIQDSASTISGKRMDKLMGRDFTASIISEVLQLAGVIDVNLFEMLEEARKGRNAWMHSIKAPDYKKASIGLRAAASMLEKTLGRSFPLDLSLEIMTY